MSIEDLLLQRAQEKCELCESDSDLVVFEVPPVETPDVDSCILVCSSCDALLNSSDKQAAEHWRCLSSSMWSTVPAVQVVAWRLLTQYSTESWAADLLEMLYLDEKLLAWAEAGSSASSGMEAVPTLDSNGAVLQSGDRVTLIKDLDVKGAGFTAKRGTTVKNISLTENPEQIEGRVNGVRIVLLTKYLKKSG